MSLKVSTSRFFVFAMPRRGSPRIRPEDEIQPVEEPESQASVTAAVGSLTVGSRQSSTASLKSSKASKISSRSSAAGKFLKLMFSNH